MWEFPKAELLGASRGMTGIRQRLPAAILETLRLRIRQLQPLIQVRHAYSHFEVLVDAFRCGIGSRDVPEGFRWVSVDRLSRYPMGRVDRKIADGLKLNQG
jgi:A/G-specific adenine glycosylase